MYFVCAWSLQSRKIRRCAANQSLVVDIIRLQCVSPLRREVSFLAFRFLSRRGEKKLRSRREMAAFSVRCCQNTNSVTMTFEIQISAVTAAGRGRSALRLGFVAWIFAQPWNPVESLADMLVASWLLSLRMPALQPRLDSSTQNSSELSLQYTQEIVFDEYSAHVRRS